MARLEVGAKAPFFTLTNQIGDEVALADFAGRRLVLYFYPADDTPGCTREACQFNDELGAFEELGVAVLGVSPSGRSTGSASTCSATPTRPSWRSTAPTARRCCTARRSWA